MKILLNILAVIVLLLIIVTFFCPVIISILTNNWCFMFLYLVIGVPIALEFMFFGALISVASDLESNSLRESVKEYSYD